MKRNHKKSIAMKRILTLLALLAATAATAQEVEIRQAIEPQKKKLNHLVIESGWDVHLVQHADSITYVSIITAPENAEALQESAAVTVKQRTMTVNPCPVRFRGTRLEIHSNFDFADITLHNAEVSADSLCLSKPFGNTKLHAYNSAVHVGAFVARHLTLVTLQHSVLRADTLRGGWTSATLKENSLLDIGNYCQEKLNVYLYDKAADNSYAFPDSTLVCRQSAHACCDSVHHIFWKDHRDPTWQAITLTISMQPYLKTYTTGGIWKPGAGGYWNHSGAPFDSPFFTPFTFELKIPMLFSWKLRNDFTFQTGLQFQLEMSPLGHQCRADEEGSLVLDEDNDNWCYNLATSMYMGLPLKLTTKLYGRLDNTFSADLFFGWCAGSLLYSCTQKSYFGSTYWQCSPTDYLNHWKIEMGISWDVNRLVIIKGLRFYANLLPEYRSVADLPEVRTMGLEIKM